MINKHLPAHMKSDDPPLPQPLQAHPQAASGAIRMRPFQRDVFLDRTTGVLVLHWSRQIGKSYVLAAWAVDRLLSRPGRLVTVLSNSRDNGAEFVRKCAEVCELLGAGARVDVVDATPAAPDRPAHIEYENMRMEVRITLAGRTGRIKVLAANPRTARGFSGDLILDEFAFHENSWAIWDAAEPILASNRDYLCRIASTGNGRHNAFYAFATGGQYRVSRVTRTQAWELGVEIFDPVTRRPVTPAEARRVALDKASYDQNYECAFRNESSALLTTALITAAEAAGEGEGEICSQDWTAAALQRLWEAAGPLYGGFDVARRRDFSVLSLFERVEAPGQRHKMSQGHAMSHPHAAGPTYILRACLRMENMRLPEQQVRLGQVMSLPGLRRVCIDMTGLGLGLCEYSREQYGPRIQGVDFGRTIPIAGAPAIAAEGRRAPTVRVTEAMATQLLQIYEAGRIRHPWDALLHEDLHKPEKIVTPGGRVSIAATRTEAGHADHFWSFALAIEAAESPGANATEFHYQPVAVSRRFSRRRTM